MDRKKIRTWQDVEDLAVSLGYTVIHKGHRHKRVVRRDGSYVTSIPVSGSDSRGPMNAASRLRQAHRQDTEGGR